MIYYYFPNTGWTIGTTIAMCTAMASEVLWLTVNRP